MIQPGDIVYHQHNNTRDRVRIVTSIGELYGYTEFICSGNSIHSFPTGFTQDAIIHCTSFRKRATINHEENT